MIGAILNLLKQPFWTKLYTLSDNAIEMAIISQAMISALPMISTHAWIVEDCHVTLFIAMTVRTS